MDWKAKLERNAIFVVLGACVATGGTVASVTEYYSGQRIEIAKQGCDSEISRLKTQLASISRSMGHEEYLDVTKIVVPRDRISPAPNSQYFDDAEFYAQRATGDWFYSKSTETALAQSLVATDVTKLPTIQATGNVAPIHLWRTRTVLRAKGDAGLKNIFPYVYVVRVPIESFKRAVTPLLSKGGSPVTGSQSKEGVRQTGNNAWLDSQFQSDIAGKFLTFYLTAQIGVQDTMPAELLNVQKVHNVVYIAIRYTLQNIEVEKVAYSHYYIYSETVIITGGPNLTMVKTWVPSPDPAGNVEYSQYISSWLKDLRVIVG
jgi:hypothetical protein